MNAAAEAAVQRKAIDNFLRSLQRYAVFSIVWYRGGGVALGKLAPGLLHTVA